MQNNMSPQNMMAMLGAQSQAAQNAQSVTQGGKKSPILFGENGAVSFKTFLEMTPGQNFDLASLKGSGLNGGALNSGALNTASAFVTGLNPLLQAQSVNGLEGFGLEGAQDSASLYQMLRANIQTMFGESAGSTVNNGDAAESTALLGDQSLQGIGNYGQNDDILFLFNAPIGMNGQASLSALTADVNAQASLEALSAKGLSNDMSQALLQIQSALSGQGAAVTGLNNAQQQIVSTNVADMNLEEFTDLKKSLYGDIAGLLTQNKERVIGDDMIMSITQGPAFLSQASASTGQGTSDLLVSLQPASPATALAASNNNAAALNAAQAAQAGQTGQVQNTAGQIADATIPSSEGFDEALLQQAQLQAGDKGNRPQGVSPNSALNGVLAQTGLSGNKQQSTIQSALLGSSALTPANAQNGLQAMDFSAFENIFSGDLESLPPALQEAHLEMAGIKADSAAPSVKANNMIYARSAGYPHPATQSIADQVNLMSSRTPQGDQNMRIQLDPPELGQVAIELKFGKDNSVKAHIAVERPETLALLQKDSASLQKALEDAGLQADSGSLEFSLDQGGDSQSGESFGDKKGGGDNSAGNGSDEGLPENVETQMTIFVDPHTGQQHVNMLV